MSSYILFVSGLKILLSSKSATASVPINTVFLFCAFASTAFYPVQGAPQPLATIFYLNPLSYLVDIIRAGIFGQVTDFVITEMLLLVALAAILFVIATKLLTKLDF